MAQGKHTDIIISLVKATTWGSAATVNAANLGLFAESFTWKDNVGELEAAGFNQDTIRRELAATGRYSFEADISFRLRHQGHELILALMMGTAGTPSGGGPYVHTLYRKVDMTGVFGSLAWDDGIKTHTVDSVKIKSLTLSSKAGEYIQATAKIIGRKRSTGATGGLSSVTEVATIGYVQALSSYLTYQMAAQGSSLAAQVINTWSVTFEADYPIDDRVYSSTGGVYMDEPAPGRFQTTGEIMVPYTVDTFNAAVLSGAIYKALLTHTTSSSAIFVVGLPSMKIISATTNYPEGYAEHKFNFRNEKAASTPSGLDLAVPYLKLTNSASADPLA